MKIVTTLFSWKNTLVLSISLITILLIANFYGTYTNTFYFFKLTNYIVPVFFGLQGIYFYALWFKITEGEYPDLQMRNLEYIVYTAIAVYLYKGIDSLLLLQESQQYETYLIPHTFVPFTVTISSLYFSLILLSILTFVYRKKMVGNYVFMERINS